MSTIAAAPAAEPKPLYASLFVQVLVALILGIILGVVAPDFDIDCNLRCRNLGDATLVMPVVQHRQGISVRILPQENIRHIGRGTCQVHSDVE